MFLINWSIFQIQGSNVSYKVEYLSNSRLKVSYKVEYLSNSGLGS